MIGKVRSTTIKKTRTTSRKIAKLIAGFAFDKKAEDIVILDMRKVSNFCDYFVVCTSSSEKRTHAISDGIEEGLLTFGIKPFRRPSYQDTKWAVLDMGAVIVHIFEQTTREFYGLEYLWQDAPRVNWKK